MIIYSYLSSKKAANPNDRLGRFIGIGESFYRLGSFESRSAKRTNTRTFGLFLPFCWTLTGRLREANWSFLSPVHGPCGFHVAHERIAPIRLVIWESYKRFVRNERLIREPPVTTSDRSWDRSFFSSPLTTFSSCLQIVPVYCLVPQCVHTLCKKMKF